jgi:tetratricopeptide (TPR) repeat protein
MKRLKLDRLARAAGRLPAGLADRNRLLAAVLALLVAAGCGGKGSGVSDDPTQVPTASTSIGAEQLDRAVARLSAKALEHPADPFWETKLGEWYARADQPSPALDHLQRALRIDEDYAPALSLLSKLYYDSGRHLEAVNLLEAARERAPLPDALMTGLALNYEALGRNEESATIFVNLQDSDAARSALTYRVLRSDKYLQATHLAREAVEAQPESAANHNNYGIALLYEGDPHTAREHFERALELDPQLAGAMYNLAIVEKFYFYDDDASRAWFARYRERLPHGDDPDGLGELLAETGPSSEPPLALHGK